MFTRERGSLCSNWGAPGPPSPVLLLFPPSPSPAGVLWAAPRMLHSRPCFLAIFPSQGAVAHRSLACSWLLEPTQLSGVMTVLPSGRVGQTRQLHQAVVQEARVQWALVTSSCSAVCPREPPCLLPPTWGSRPQQVQAVDFHTEAYP